MTVSVTVQKKTGTVTKKPSVGTPFVAPPLYVDEYQAILDKATALGYTAP